MSRGLAVSAWKSLEINENICDIMQHQFVGPSPTKFLILLVRTAGLEPAQGFPQGILSPLRLPFRHVRGCGQLYDAADADNYMMPRKRTTARRPRKRKLYDVHEGGQLYKIRESDQPGSL
jgi:hypothetical protein